jgi:hypothetical protein
MATEDDQVWLTASKYRKQLRGRIPFRRRPIALSSVPHALRNPTPAPLRVAETLIVVVVAKLEEATWAELVRGLSFLT